MAVNVIGDSEFARLMKERLEERRNVICAQLLAGEANTFEHYRYLAGYVAAIGDGLEDIESTNKELWGDRT
jgi:hypothetical protein